MKKLIGFLFLLLIVKYNLGENCSNPGPTTVCKTLQATKEKALCLGISTRPSTPCGEIECKDANNTILDANKIKCEDFPASDLESCVNVTGTKCELRLKECSQVSRDSEETCNQHPVHSGNEATHICAFDSSNKTCIEQYLCEFVPTSDTEINCETYPVKKANQNTHTCVKDISGTKPCKEQVKNIPTTVPNMETETVLPLTSTVLNKQFQIWKQLLLYKQQKIKKQYYL